MNTEFWSMIDSASFAFGGLWVGIAYVILGLADNLIALAFKQLEELGEMRRDRRRKKKKDDQDLEDPK